MRGSLNSVVIAIMMVYLVQIQFNINFMFTMASTTEEYMVSFSRCNNLLYIPQEREQKKTIPLAEDGKEWISQGEIEFDRYTVSYRPDTPIVLNGVTFKINSKEKIGVVGRTGAGKSTLCIAICRIIEKNSGAIKIDGVDISKLGLIDLRSRITIVPQEATLFKGTLRFNLDPENKNDDFEIMRLLNKAGLADLTLRDGNGLGFLVENKGENMSSGEKQIICICRAILRVSHTHPILLILSWIFINGASRKTRW